MSCAPTLLNPTKKGPKPRKFKSTQKKPKEALESQKPRKPPKKAPDKYWKAPESSFYGEAQQTAEAELRAALWRLAELRGSPDLLPWFHGARV